ncbi:MAG: hypothetical protein ACE5IR_11365 [bacterium]
MFDYLKQTIEKTGACQSSRHLESIVAPPQVAVVCIVNRLTVVIERTRESGSLQPGKDPASIFCLLTDGGLKRSAMIS